MNQIREKYFLNEVGEINTKLTAKKIAEIYREITNTPELLDEFYKTNLFERYLEDIYDDMPESIKANVIESLLHRMVQGIKDYRSRHGSDV
jgi:hypothetical protein